MTLEQLLEQATPLPWDAKANPGISGPRGELICRMTDGGKRLMDDGEPAANYYLIIHAVNMLPKLVEVLEKTIPVLRGQFNESDRKWMASRLDTILAEANNPEVSK